MGRSPSSPGGADRISPEDAFALLGDETRISILQALWDAFESGTGENELTYSALFEEAAIEDSGNFSYHLEKLTGPFVRSTDTGYELKQTGINVVRAVVTGTVIDDPEFGPTPVSVACPRCGGPVEVAYDDEVITAHCTSCPGTRYWGERPGFLFGGLVPPVSVAHRSIEAVFQASIVYVNYQIAALQDGACPHCASPVETTVDVCTDHHPREGGLCPNCDWAHMAEGWLVCSTCKRSAFPPVRVLVLYDPRVTAFYQDHGIDFRFASWETVVRSIDVEEALLSEDPLRMRLTIPAGDETLSLIVDDDLQTQEVRR